MKVFRIVAIVILTLSVPAVGFAAGAHDLLNCVGCHGIHDAKGDIIFAVEPNKKSINPRTKQPFTGVTALCLGCHEDIEKGGMGILVISSKHSHPFGVSPNPKVATVPGVFLRGGQLECVGCHDPHPSNPNYKYLRVDTAKGANIQNFCAMCHGSKTDAKVAKGVKIFNSMDERNFVRPAPPPPPAPITIKKKKK
jgi:predicted CXXCH cytochrome family protein